MEQARRDVVRFCNEFCWTYDPREATSSIPFHVFPKQAEFLRWLTELENTRESGVVEKCRDCGATFLAAAYALHGWLFRDGFAAGFGSRKAEYVDRQGDPKTIFEKIRFMLYHLPKWLLPKGFDERKHDNYMRLLNPQNGSTITGESGDGIGRGGRTALYFVDESAFIEHPHLLERSLSANTNVRVDISTPNGPGTMFAQRRFSGKFKVFVFDWKDDPRKNSTETLPDGRVIYPWFEEQKAKHDPITVNQEILRDHSASVEGICIPAAWVRAAVNFMRPNERTKMLAAGLDVAEFGRDLCVFIPRMGPIAADPVEWGQCLTSETAWRAMELCHKYRIPILFYDVTGVGAGVRGVLDATDRAMSFQPHAVEFGSSPTDAVWPDGRTSKEMFKNLRAEMWWNLRMRFERVYEYVEKGISHPIDEMISIPDHPQLIAELSLPLVERTENGKIQLESKEKMRSRGVKSPNFADALALAFFPGDAWDGSLGGPQTVQEGQSILASVPRGTFSTDDLGAWRGERKPSWHRPEAPQGDSAFGTGGSSGIPPWGPDW